MGQNTSRFTIKDVAARAGVSLGTVSRVINGNKKVSIKNTAKVQEAMRDLSFVPNAAAQSMRLNQTKAIAFVVSDISNPLFGKIAKAAERVMKDKGYFFIFSSTDQDIEQERRLLKLFDAGRVDAMMLTLSDEHDPESLELISRSSIPCVMLDREIGQTVDAILSDHQSGMRRALDYLVGIGHSRISLITGSESERPGRERITGYKVALINNGLPFDPELLQIGNLSEDFGYRASHRLLRMADRPTAIIAGGNRILTGVIRAYRELGLRIPDDLSIIGCDETELSALIEPPMTLISRNIEQIGRAAGELLINRLEGRAEDEVSRIMFPTELVVRSSCAAPKTKIKIRTN